MIVNRISLRVSFTVAPASSPQLELPSKYTLTASLRGSARYRSHDAS